MLRCGRGSHAFRGSGRSADWLKWGYARNEDLQGAGRGQSADDAGGFRVSRRRQRALQPSRACTFAGRGRPRRGRPRPRWRLPRLDRPSHRPQPQGQVRRARALGRGRGVVGKQRPDGARRLRAAPLRHARPHPRVRALRAGSLRRRRPRLPPQRPRHHRARLARPLHPPPAPPPGARGARAVRARLHHPELPLLPRRPRPARLPLRDGHRHLLRAAPRADRRHRLCRREQEVGLHRPQLPPARAGGDADALLGQPRRGRPRRRRRLLRPLRHRQDHPLRRPGPRPHRRRRARLVRRRHLQLRGRLLRQDHQPLRRRPSPRSTPPPPASAPSSRTWSGTR